VSATVDRFSGELSHNARWSLLIVPPAGLCNANPRPSRMCAYLVGWSVWA